MLQRATTATGAHITLGTFPGSEPSAALCPKGKAVWRGTPKQSGQCCLAALKPSFWFVFFTLSRWILQLDLMLDSFCNLVPCQLLGRELTVDLDADNASENFSRKWTGTLSVPATERSDIILLHSDTNSDAFPQLYGEHSPCVAEDFGAEAWQLAELHVEHLDSIQLETLIRPLDFWENSHESCPLVLGPSGSEPSWRVTALEAKIERAKTDLGRLPWGSNGSSFKCDLWQGTVVSLLDITFSPATFGAQDGLASQVATAGPFRLTSFQDLQGVPFRLKRTRSEPLDEAVCRLALHLSRVLELPDPRATQLETGLTGHFDTEILHGDVCQFFSDAFQMKTPPTLPKRASSMTRFARLLRGAGQLYQLRLSEPWLYSALSDMRAAGAKAEAAQHSTEAPHFVVTTVKLLVADLLQTVSARCCGVARDMLLGKNLVCHKQPLIMEQVRHLGILMHASGTVLQCSFGQLMFCTHPRIRWEDTHCLKPIEMKSGYCEFLVHTDVLTLETALTTEARPQYLPYVTLGPEVSSKCWTARWLAVHQTEELECCDFALPSYSEDHCRLVGIPTSATVAARWLRGSPRLVETPCQLQLVESHLHNATLMFWAGRCTRGCLYLQSVGCWGIIWEPIGSVSSATPVSAAQAFLPKSRA